MDDFSLMMVAYGDMNSFFVGIISTRGISNDWSGPVVVSVFILNFWSSFMYTAAANLTLVANQCWSGRNVTCFDEKEVPVSPQ